MGDRRVGARHRPRPLIELMADEAVLRCFTPDVGCGIFFHMAQTIPAPIFDTQIAAMVCGFGEVISYDKVVSRLAGVQIDKSTRFADWARRPLSRSRSTMRWAT